MKLIIQIPCYNEAETLPGTIKALPKKLDGISTIEVLVIDDGSTDGTAEIARKLGVTHVVELSSHQGLAKTFAMGLKYAVREKADVIVNTDADNQYSADSISTLIQPILSGKSDLVVGCRPIESISHFSKIKKILQRSGSRMVQLLTGLEIPDVTSGFRAYSYLAARKLKIFSDFTYTIESLIQTGHSGLRIVSVPVDVNPPTRESRLFVSNWYYIRRQVATILRIWALYNPMKLFSRSGFTFLGLGGLLVIRFIYFYLASWPEPSGKVQSLIIAAVLLLTGFFLVLIGVIADLIAVNRRLTEEMMEQIDHLDIDSP
jgi:glycosyltransferase involved in cell wall biosynthesis